MKASDFLSREELREFTERSDLQGTWVVAFNWLLVAAIFAITARWTNPLTLVLAIVLLGGRQMGLAVLMHEAGHKSLFRSARLNEVVGQWLCAYPILGDCAVYAASHREHHRLAGTDQDPDLPNYRDYPVSAERLRRKLTRDLSGRTGFKLVSSMITGSGRSIMMRDGERSPLGRGLLANGALFAALLTAGVPELFGLWVIAYLTTYPLIARIRQVAEHANVPDLNDADPRLNTRTTIARWFERLLLCPNHVNYHVEHHLLASVPCYRLPALHRLLRARGFYDGHEQTLARGYADVLRRVLDETPPVPARAA